jgi:hypothetical protein
VKNHVVTWNPGVSAPVALALGGSLVEIRLALGIGGDEIGKPKLILIQEMLTYQPTPSSQ